MRVTFKTDLSKLYPALDKHINRVENRVGAIAESTAIETGNWMRRNAPWNDITGEARRTTVAWVEKKNGIYTIVLAVGVFYGRFLETANGGRFRIVEPALHYAVSVWKLFSSRKSDVN